MSPAEVPSSPSQPPASAAGNAAEATTAKHSLWSWASTTGLVALAALLLGAGALPWWLSNPQRLSGYIAKAAPDLQAEITIGKAQIGWLGPLVLEEVTLVPRSGARNPATIARIEGSHGLAGILLSAGDLGTFRVQGLRADVVFDANRDSNLKGLIAPPAGALTVAPGQPTAAPESDAPPAELPPQPRLSPVRARIEVEDAVVRIEGPWSLEAWVSEPIDLRASLATAASGGYSEWTIEPTQLLREAQLEPSVAQGVLAYIAPVLADATRTGGRFSLRLDGATLPLGAPLDARLSGLLTMHAVDLGPGPLVTHILEELPGNMQLPTSVRIADDSRIEFQLADRRMWHKGLEFGLPLAKPGSRLDLSSSGSVGIEDKTLDLKLALPLPADLPADRPLLGALAGKTVSIGIVGVLGEPKVSFDGSIRAVAGDVVVNLIDRLRGGRRGAPVPRARVVAPPPANPPPPAAPAEAARSTPPPPPRPNWTPPADAGSSLPATVASPTAEATPIAPPELLPPGPVVAQRSDKANADPAAAAEAPADSAAAAQGGRAGAGKTAEKLGQLKGQLPPEISNNPSTDRIIDLVGGVMDEVARRRAERASVPPEGAPAGAAEPRRGRLLRRLLPPAPPAGPPPTQP